MNPFDLPDTSQTHATRQAAKTPAAIIGAEAAKCGVLTFARFMELALYCPDCGYYETKKDSPGRRGDFYTSVSVGDLFGQLLAFQFAEWLEELLMGDCRLAIAEAGAHDGKLAKDILNWLQIHRPKLFSEIEYIILEPSSRRQEWQRETLAEFGDKIRWLAQISELKNRQSPIGNRQFIGLIFSNELLDAFPIHRFGWEAKNKKWFEWGVAVEGENFVWTKIPDSKFQIPNSELESVLPDNYTVEISPAAENWWRTAATVLERGKLLTIDYGLTDAELFLPERKNGTLRGFYRHHFADNLLANPGEQDLTAHVNFSAIQKAGESAGLTTELLSTQTRFLTRILEKTLKEKSFGELVASKRSEGGWTSAQTRQFQMLTHPEHLGRAFHILIQNR